MKKQLYSFIYAARGIIQAFTEPHMRFHLVMCGYVLYFSLFYETTKAEYSALFLTMALVMVAECINSAIEKACDGITREKNETIGKAKDMAAGAVLLSCIFAVIIGFVLFWDTEILWQIVLYFSTELTRLIPLLASVAVSVLFVSGKLYTRRGKNE